MRKSLTIVLSTLFLAAGLIPARTVHYCRMLERATVGDCGVCHVRANQAAEPLSCCAAKSASSEGIADISTDVTAPECCSLRVREPFAAAAAGAMDAPSVRTNHDQTASLAATPVATLVWLNWPHALSPYPHIVYPTIAPPPARLSGSGFLC
jgi:hypothetical protein